MNHIGRRGHGEDKRKGEAKSRRIGEFPRFAGSPFLPYFFPLWFKCLLLKRQNPYFGVPTYRLERRNEWFE